ncbi:MAG: hypothetical protein ACI9E1_000476 [Cryomorphaceae bacterium]|jgi:uncharacterized protein YigE (DUF2233 family)
MPRRSKNSSPLKLMSHLSTITVISCATACQPSVSTPQLVEGHFKGPPQKKLTPTIDIIPQIPLPTKLHQLSHKGIQFNLVTFDNRNLHLVVADQPNGPGSLWRDAAAAAKAHNGLAAINAGFFTPEGKPLGIVISNGKKIGSHNTSSLGSGLFYHTATGAKISRRSAWSDLSKNPPDHLLQSGPMLLENAKSITGLSNKNSRPRSFIASDGKYHWCIGHADSCTLSQLSEALASLKTSEFIASTALNLDGGRSSDLWVSATVNGGSKQIRPFWNKPVRNFLILKSN